MFEDINLEFPVTVYGNLEKYNETISKGRCRVFYKYGNRNGTYITDEFAEKLLSSVFLKCDLSGFQLIRGRFYKMPIL